MTGPRKFYFDVPIQGPSLTSKQYLYTQGSAITCLHPRDWISYDEPYILIQIMYQTSKKNFCPSPGLLHLI